MGVDETLAATLKNGAFVAGVGCRRGAAAADIVAAIRAAVERAGLSLSALGAIATIAAKETEFGIAAAARELGVRIVFVPEADLQAASPRTQTHSARALTLTGVPSVAEAAALAAAGPAARLVASRLIVGAATCALARHEAAP
jgi:cobalt-precorrin 5A hydrolase